MQDRVSLYPGRVKLEPVAGQANLYDLTRADQPTQEGTPLNKASLLQDVVCDILGLDYAATPNDAFMSLALPSGKYAISVTLKSPGGRLMQGVALSGIVTAAGNPVVTNSNGVGFGFATTSPVTATADISAFLDLTGTASVTVTPTAGVVNKAEITCTRASSAQTTISTSKTVRFSPDVSEYDFSAIGGGSDGGNGSFSVSSSWVSAYGGSGGGSGAVINKANVKNTSDPIPVVVGSLGGISKVGTIETPEAISGGDAGSHAGSVDNDSLSYSKGSPGLPVNTDFLYPPTVVGGSGGGGGALVHNYGRNSGEGGLGGSPGGGNGATCFTGSTIYNGSDGLYPGSGGGGGSGRGYGSESSPKNMSGAGGKGKPGLVGFMWRYAA